MFLGFFLSITNIAGYSLQLFEASIFHLDRIFTRKLRNEKIHPDFIRFIKNKKCFKTN